MKYLILISFLFLTIYASAQTIRVPWYEIEAAPDSGYIARSTSIDGDGAWYLPTYREGDTIAVWNPNTRKLEFRTKASVLSGIPSGSGTNGTLTKWTGINTIGDAAITENATRLSASLPFRMANIPTVSLPGVPSSGDVVMNTTENELWAYRNSSWDAIAYWRKSGSNIYYNTGGNVSIGATSSATSSFYVLGNNNEHAATIRPNASVSSAYNTFQVLSTSGVVQFSVNRNGVVNVGRWKIDNATIDFYTSSAYTTQLGSIGQGGTFAGSATFGIFSSIATRPLMLSDYTRGVGIYGQTEIRGQGTTSSTYGLIVHNNSGTSNTLIVRDDAKVGILTNTPSASLGIAGDLAVSTLVGDAETIGGWTSANKATKITYESIIDSLIANGLISTNIYTADGTATGNRKYSANNTTLTFDNLAGLTFSGEGTVTIEDTLSAATLNITRDNGSVTTTGATIASIAGRTRRAGDVVSDIARIDMIYGGDATDQYGIMDLGVRGQSSYGGQNVRLFSANAYQEKRAVLGYLASNYPGTWSTDAVVTLSGRSTVENTLAIHDEGSEVFRVEYDGETYVQDFAHVGGAFFTQTAIDTVNNTASETSLINTGEGTTTLPADYLEPGRTIVCEGQGWWSNNSVTPSLQFRQKIGAVTVGDTGSGSVPDLSGGQEFWEYKVIMTCQSEGVSGTVMTQGVWTWQYSDFTDGRKLSFSNTTTATVNTTISNALDFTVQMGSADANAFVVMTNFVCKAEN